MTPFPDARYLLSEVDPGRVKPCVAEVAFVGRSNVGKSSLINALLGQPLAKVSQTPGRTRTINVYQVVRDRWLVDLPGYGFATGPQAERHAWRGMIETYLSRRSSLRGVFLLVDAEVGPTALDLQMAQWLRERELPVHAVAAKSDKVKPSRHVPQRQEVARTLGVPPESLAWLSAAKGDGIDGLRDVLKGDLKLSRPGRAHI